MNERLICFNPNPSRKLWVYSALSLSDQEKNHTSHASGYKEIQKMNKRQTDRHTKRKKTKKWKKDKKKEWQKEKKEKREKENNVVYSGH